jgi:hypothetical protein
MFRLSMRGLARQNDLNIVAGANGEMHQAPTRLLQVDLALNLVCKGLI